MPVIILVILGVLGIGSTATVIASNPAKPGDPLYAIDQIVENVQLALSSTQAQEDLRVKLAEERITEIQTLLQEKGVIAPGLDVALANLTEQKQKIAQLLSEQKANGIAIEQKAEELDDQFELKEQELERIFEEAKAPLKAQKKQLKAQLKEALAANDTARAGQLRAEITQIEAQLDALEAKEEDTEKLLEAEEERIEAELETQEKAQEEKEELLEKQQEELEEKEESLREQAED